MSNVHPELIEKAKQHLNLSKRPSSTFKTRILQDTTLSRASLRQKYLAALKSGNYLQLKRSLREKYVKRTIVRVTMPSLIEAFKHYDFSRSDAAAPNSTIETEYAFAFCAIGLAYHLIGGNWDYNSPSIYSSVRHAYGLKINRIIKLNDGGLSFEDIAFEVETNPWYYWDNTR